MCVPADTYRRDSAQGGTFINQSVPSQLTRPRAERAQSCVVVNGCSGVYRWSVQLNRLGRLARTPVCSTLRCLRSGAASVKPRLCGCWYEPPYPACSSRYFAVEGNSVRFGPRSDGTRDLHLPRRVPTRGAGGQATGRSPAAGMACRQSASRDRLGQVRTFGYSACSLSPAVVLDRRNIRAFS